MKLNRPSSKRLTRLLLVALVICGICGSAAANAEPKKADSILDLQQFKSESTLELKGGNSQTGVVKLINLNPNINVSYLLELSIGGATKFYNLYNPLPELQRLTLDQAFPNGITLTTQNRVDRCELWDETGKSNLELMLKTKLSYQPICDEKINLLVPVEGRSTTKEAVADFLRRNVWQGEQITTIVKNTLFKDSYLQVAEETRA